VTVPAPAPAVGARRILAIAVPVVLSNATGPLQGAVDTAVIGNLGSEVHLAGVGLGAQVFSLLFVSFNFLQIASSGLSAQALGARDMGAVLDTLARALAVAAACAAGLILLQWPLRAAGLALFEGSAQAEAMAGLYFDIRIWGAPAELGNYALLGWFAGQEMTRRMFRHQIVVSALNVALSLLFVLGFGWGVAGVALGTVLAAFGGLAYGLWLARGRARAIRPGGWRADPGRILDRGALLAVMTLNRDIFIRTAVLVASFAWMTRLGSTLGDATLAANVVLWQFLMVSANALDGFAIAAETLVGQAMGARDPRALRRAAVATSLWAGALAAVMALGLAVLSGPIIDLFTTAPEVRALARDHALWAALTPLAGFAAFQLDGVFIGATGAREMRDAMLGATAVYVPASLALTAAFGNHGVWAALILLLLLRAGALLALYPRLEARAAA
jgi:MATE family multidrug resistance protein